MKYMLKFISTVLIAVSMLPSIKNVYFAVSVLSVALIADYARSKFIKFDDIARKMNIITLISYASFSLAIVAILLTVLSLAEMNPAGVFLDFVGFVGFGAARHRVDVAFFRLSNELSGVFFFHLLLSSCFTPAFLEMYYVRDGESRPK